jgi:hypothetical protein
MGQLILHLIGDYIAQSDWMAQNKTKSWFPALCHAIIYSLLFCFITDYKALLVIFITHYFIDRYRLARYVVFIKNFIISPFPKPKWEDCKATGYPSSNPIWLSIWLLIVTDNTMHLAINYLSIKFL